MKTAIALLGLALALFTIGVAAYLLTRKPRPAPIPPVQDFTGHTALRQDGEEVTLDTPPKPR